MPSDCAENVAPAACANVLVVSTTAAPVAEKAAMRGSRKPRAARGDADDDAAPSSSGGGAAAGAGELQSAFERFRRVAPIAVATTSAAPRTCACARRRHVRAAGRRLKRQEERRNAKQRLESARNVRCA